MKTTISFFLTILLISSSTIFFGQEAKSSQVKIASADISSGQTLLSKGIFFVTTLTQGNNLFQITLSDDKIFLNSFFKLGNTGFSAGPSTGYFKNVPFVAIIGTFRPFNSKVISTFHWAGYSFGQPEGVISLNPTFLFAVNTVNIDVWKLRASYSFIFFQKEKMKHGVSLRYTDKIIYNLYGYAEATYDIPNRKQLLKLGLTFKFM